MVSRIINSVSQKSESAVSLLSYNTLLADSGWRILLYISLPCCRHNALIAECTICGKAAGSTITIYLPCDCWKLLCLSKAVFRFPYMHGYRAWDKSFQLSKDLEYGQQECYCPGKNPDNHKRSKHIRIKYRWIREQVGGNNIKLNHSISWQR